MRAGLRLALAAAELEAAPRALPGLVPPLHRGPATQTALAGVLLRLQGRDASRPAGRYSCAGAGSLGASLDVRRRFSTSSTPCTLRALPTRSSIISAESTSPRSTTLPFSASTSTEPFGTS